MSCWGHIAVWKSPRTNDSSFHSILKCFLLFSSSVTHPDLQKLTQLLKWISHLQTQRYMSCASKSRKNGTKNFGISKVGHSDQYQIPTQHRLGHKNSLNLRTIPSRRTLSEEYDLSASAWSVRKNCELIYCNRCQIITNIHLKLNQIFMSYGVYPFSFEMNQLGMDLQIKYA